MPVHRWHLLKSCSKQQMGTKTIYFQPLCFIFLQTQSRCCLNRSPAMGQLHIQQRCRYFLWPVLLLVCMFVWTLTQCDISLPQKAVAVAEQEALLSRLSQTQEACDHLKEQLEALHRHSLSLQESCTSLQTLNTQLQVITADFHNLVHLN